MELANRCYFHKRPSAIFKGHREWVWTVAASEQGVICSGSQDRTVAQWSPVRASGAGVVVVDGCGCGGGGGGGVRALLRGSGARLPESLPRALAPLV